MKSFLSIKVLAFAICAIAIQAKAQIQLGEPVYGGNGCKAGSAAISLTEDHQTISVLFDSFAAEAGNTTGRRIDRKSCNLRIPIHVDAGYSVALMKVDYRGFNAIPAGAASTTFNTELFFAGRQGPKITKKFSGPLADDFLISNEYLATTVVWSECGKDLIFGINASAVAMSDSSMRQTMMIVDSADITNHDLGLRYSFVSRRCQ